MAEVIAPITELLQPAARGNEEEEKRSDSPPLGVCRFALTSPLLPRPLAFDQDPANVIGFKLYPGALVFLRWLEALPSSRRAELFRDRTIVELGAGVTGIPSIALGIACGAAAVLTTDLPDRCALLRANVAKAYDDCGVKPCCTAAVQALPWGEVALPQLPAAFRDGADVLVGADIIYHEFLYEPLLTTMRSFAEAAVQRGKPPPLVVVSYLRRFKKCARFWKAAAALWDISYVPMGRVVDTDDLVMARDAPTQCTSATPLVMKCDVPAEVLAEGVPQKRLPSYPLSPMPLSAESPFATPDDLRRSEGAFPAFVVIMKWKGGK